jgi:hypothetical protein
MKERKPIFEKNTNTKTINRREQRGEDNGRSHPMGLEGNRNKMARNEHH